MNMSRKNPWASKPHRFAVEELLDLYPVVRSPNSHAPAPAKVGRRIKEPNKEETTASKPRKGPQATGASKGKKFE